MTRRSLTQEQIGSLEFQIGQIYHSFARATDTGECLDAKWAAAQFKEYVNVLMAATGYSEFMAFGRDTKRADVFDRYILLYAIGSLPAYKMEDVAKSRQHGHAMEAKPTEVTPSSLIEAINDTGKTYLQLQAMAMKLSDAQEFAGIRSVLEYIMNPNQRN